MNARLRVVAVGVLLTAAATACGGGESTSEGGGKVDVVKIAAPIELTGPVAAFGVSYTNALELAIEKINEAGGIESLDGAELELVKQDSQSDPEMAVQFLREMKADGATVAVGPVSSAAVLAVKPVLKSLELPWIGASVDDGVTEDNADRTMWRVVDRFGNWAEATMDFVEAARDSGDIKVDKIGIVTISSAPGPTLEKVLEARAKAAGMEVVKVSYDPAETRDFSNVIATLRDADVDMVTGLNYPGDAILFAEAVALQDWQPAEGFVWVAGGQYLNSFREALGRKTENWLDASYGAPTTGCALTEKFAAEYQAKHGEPLTGLALAAPATIQVIASALEAAGSVEPAAFKKAMADVKIDNCTGLWTMAGSVAFDAKGDNTAWVPTLIQHEGELGQVAVWPEDGAARPAKWPAVAP